MIYRSQGCTKCKNRGIIGRVAIHEVFRMTPALEEVVSEGATAPRILKEAKSQGMMTMREEGVIKALDGTVSLEDVLRETE